VVLEFSQYLAGPSAGLRLADLGARVIKIERPGVGDACRQLAIRNQWVEESSLLFHTINRNKESIATNLKDPTDLGRVRDLIARADVLTHNFRPGVMEKIGLDYANVAALNPRLIYADITGYGKEGPWKSKPGQDLLVQSLSGLSWLTGNRDAPPTPMGLAVADLLCGCHFAQGILGLLVRRETTGRGGYVEASLLESILDAQFELLTSFFADGEQAPVRSARGNANAYLSAPYGIYATRNGFLALAMGDGSRLADLLDCEDLQQFREPGQWFVERDRIMSILARIFSGKDTEYWLERLEAAGIWCSPVLNYEALIGHEAYAATGMEHTVRRDSGAKVRTLRCPIEWNGAPLESPRPAPRVGECGNITTLPADSARASLPDPGNGKLPLDGLLVLDFSQFLSGPCAGLRLADLGARVIKIEKPGAGDICRSLYVSNLDIDKDSTIFHAINRNKESFAADLKDPADLEKVLRLVRHADVAMHNFRPGVAERLGIGYEQLKRENETLVYGAIHGFGRTGPWKDRPGQDLLVQCLSGMAWLSGNAKDAPMAMGLSVIDLVSGQHLVQGLLAALYHRIATGEGSRVEVSMLASALDFQFETWTTFQQDGNPVERTESNNAHAFVAAPYGIYETSSGYLALAMGSIPQLGELLACPELGDYTEPDSWFLKRNEIKKILADHLATRSTSEWLNVLEPADIWCAGVLDWTGLMEEEAYRCLGMKQKVLRSTGSSYDTTRCPIRIDGERLYSDKGSPEVGEHTRAICREFDL